VIAATVKGGGGKKKAGGKEGGEEETGGGAFSFTVPGREKRGLLMSLAGTGEGRGGERRKRGNRVCRLRTERKGGGEFERGESFRGGGKRGGGK